MRAAVVVLVVALLAVGVAAATGTKLAELFRVQCTAAEVEAGCGWKP